MPETKELLAVFARAPELGRVKTRLSPPLTADQALALHRALVEDTLERFGRLPRPGLSRHLLLSRPLLHPADLAVPRGWKVGIQAPGDLGERLSQLFLTACGRGTCRVVVLGSDSPTLPLGTLTEAFEGLASHEVVVGPAEDGGYYLIGARRFVPEIFRGIPWGTSKVLQATLSVLGRERISYARLAGWYDIDRPDDLRRLRREIDDLKRRASPEVPRRVDAVLPSEIED